MSDQCKSCGGFCGKSGCERLNTNHPDYDKTEWDVRGLLAESLKCWHRLTGEEAAELVAFVQAAQAAQPAPRRLTEAEITLLVEAYYEDFGSAPPDLIRQVESLIFGDAQPAHAHAIDTSPERVEKQAGDVQVPGWRSIDSAPKDKSVLLYVNQFLPVYCGRKRHGNLGEPQQGAFAWRCDSSGRFSNPTHWMPLPAAPSTKEGQP